MEEGSKNPKKDQNNILISLENFDPTTNKKDILTSPRSLEACRREGISPRELLMKNIETI